MSEGTVDIFREAVEAFNRRDRAAWLALCDPEYENLPPRDWPEAASIRGPEAIWDFFTSNMDLWEGGRFDLGELIDAGDGIVVAEMRAQVRGKSSGADLLWRYWHVITYRERRALRSDWFNTRGEALEAAGLSG